MCILIDTKHKTLVCSKTGKTVKLDCFDDLIAYHAYLLGRGGEKKALCVLKDAFNGSKVITDMVLTMRGEKK